MMDENPDIIVTGCERGKAHYREWQQGLENRKREQKAMYKSLREALPAEKRGEYDAQLWSQLEQSYILSLRRFNLEPNRFCQNYQDFSDNHWITLVKHYNVLEKHYENALKLKAPVQVREAPLDTLK